MCNLRNSFKRKDCSTKKIEEKTKQIINKK